MQYAGMDFIIYIMETIIGVYIIRKAFKKRKELEKTVEELLENVRRRNQEIQKEQRKNAELMEASTIMPEASNLSKAETIRLAVQYVSVL